MIREQFIDFHCPCGNIEQVTAIGFKIKKKCRDCRNKAQQDWKKKQKERKKVENA